MAGKTPDQIPNPQWEKDPTGRWGHWVHKATGNVVSFGVDFNPNAAGVEAPSGPNRADDPAEELAVPELPAENPENPAPPSTPSE